MMHIVDIINLKKLKVYEIPAHHGEGVIKMNFFFEEQKGIGMWNFFANAELPIGGTVGYHKHEGNDEWYFILDGKATVTIDGKKKVLKKGDGVLTKSGSSHGIDNVTQDLKFIAVEVKRK